MTTVESARDAFRAERAVRNRGPRTPLLVRLARLAGRYTPTWRRLQTGLMAYGAATAVVLAAWDTWGRGAGLAAVAGALLALEALGGER